MKAGDRVQKGAYAGTIDSVDEEGGRAYVRFDQGSMGSVSLADLKPEDKSWPPTTETKAPAV